MRHYPTQIKLKEYETEKIYFPGEIGVFLHMIRTYPGKSLSCIGGLVLILALMFGMIFTFGLAQDPIAMINSQPAIAAAAKAATK